MGYDIEVIAAVAKKLGVKVEYVETPTALMRLRDALIAEPPADGRGTLMVAPALSLVS